MKRSLLKRINEKWASNIVDPSLADCYTTLFLLPDGRLVKCDDLHYQYAKTIGSDLGTLLLEGVARLQNVETLGIEIKRLMTREQRATIHEIFQHEAHYRLTIEFTKRGEYSRETHHTFRPIRTICKKFDKFFES
jgi:hypothetical protein